MTDEEKIILNRLKPACIEAGEKYHILPSVLGALAIYESNWITNTDYAISNNLYMIPVDNNHIGKIYSKVRHKVYKNASYYTKKENEILYKAYDIIDDSIYEYAKVLVEARRSPNGPYKYALIREEKDPLKCIDILIRAGYATDHLGSTFEDLTIPAKIKGIILKYELFLWDQEV